MFEDETVGIECPQCDRRNFILVREFEQNSEMHLVCEGCNAHLKVDAREFQERLDKIRDELEELQVEAKRGSGKTSRPRKGDFQI